nr:hypothetical protein [Tanacetum cinerariifolium]
SNSSKTSKAVIHHEFINTPNGSVYWVPRVSTSVLPVLGTVYDSLDECIEIYRKYASKARFDPKKNDRQVRSSNFRVCGCKARVVFDMVVDTTKPMKLRSAITISLVISYKMVFVPFTAIDNYRRSVTFGSGLLKKETAKTYGWLLRAFKKAFVCPPNTVVTDQDGAMRLAVVVKFPKSSWVPAFFFDSPLCGLMGTTSRSESKNLFFSNFTSSGSTLVKFMLFCYESAMERQRHTQEKLDHQSFDLFPALLTPLPIEEHAAKVYTRSLFIRVQKEIVAGSWLCLITGMSSDEKYTVRIIDEEKIKLDGLPEVIDKESILENVEEEINLHQKTKDLIPPNLRNKKNRYGEKNEAIEKLAMEASSILDSCVHMLRNNMLNFIQEFMGVKKPDKVKVKNPTGVKPKGREKQKRIKSGREISIKKSVKKRNKKLNGCGVCGSTSHNRRTCPRKNDVDVLYPAVVVPSGGDHVDCGLRDGASGSVSV